ncbi:hypothetical protein FJY94_01775 [Candidatus Kaiserbacteria bacterium]|nr:hypothetical protein [Candidatus Kaiserbacteria bacterium]
MPPENNAVFSAELQERFVLLPKVVQDAILSADVSKRLRALASTHQLHIDQWEVLEQEVQLTLLGMQPLEELAKNLETELHIPFDQAGPLAADISRAVFEPIRAELERQLEHPEAKEEEKTAIETAAAQALATDSIHPAETAVAATPTTPSTTPPTTTPEQPVSAIVVNAPPAAPTTPVAMPEKPLERTSATAPSYTSGAASHERKIVEGDPYREQLS